MAKTILEALNELVEKQGGNTEDNKLIVDAINDLVNTSGGGSSGGASFPTITLKDEYNDETEQWSTTVVDYGEFENFDGLVTIGNINVFLKFEGSDGKELCSVIASGSTVYLTTMPRCAFGGGTWRFNSQSYAIYNDGTVNVGDVSYTATRN